jgi:4-hydroxybenzoate polyprenyltransferase
MRQILIFFILLPTALKAFTAPLSRPWEYHHRQYFQSSAFVLHSSTPKGVNDDKKDNEKPPTSVTSNTDVVKKASNYSINATNTASRALNSFLSAKTSTASFLPELLSMIRPSNLPGVVLFHMLGSYLVIQQTAIGSVTVSFWNVLYSPQMLLTLVALLLTSSTSMLVNDYYDYKLGNDNLKIHKPLPAEKVTLSIVKSFLASLYAISLICVTGLPGAPARIAVTMGLIVTFLYTKHLKPKTWLKNAVCAGLISLSPLTSGLAALNLMSANHLWQGVAPLLKLVSIIFVGIFGREITMDINDVEDDSKYGIQTVPVVYGRKFASKIGLICSFGMVALTMSSPLSQVMKEGKTTSVIRRVVLSSFGSLAQFWRSFQVYRSEGMDREINERAVNEGLLTVSLILAGFL